MIIDKDLTLSSEQAVTASAASTNYIDQGGAGDAYGQELYLVVQCQETATSAGSSTVTITVETDDNTSFSSATTVYRSEAIAKASVVDNAELVKIRLPKGLERYFRVYYTVAVANLSAGKFNAFLVCDVKQGAQ